MHVHNGAVLLDYRESQVKDQYLKIAGTTDFNSRNECANEPLQKNAETSTKTIPFARLSDSISWRLHFF